MKTCSDSRPLPDGLQRSCDLKVYSVSGNRRWDERREPAHVPADTKCVTQITQKPQAVGSAGREPLPGGLTPKQQKEMEEEEGGHQQETHHTRIGDEGEGKGSGWHLTWNEHDPGDEQQQDTVQRHAFLQDDDEDLGIHQGGVQETRPHEQQAAQEVAVVSKSHTLVKEDAVMVSSQHTHFAVIAVGAAWRSVCLAGITVPPALTHAFSTQEHPLDAGAGCVEEQGVPADVPQHEVLTQQVHHLPPGRPHRLLLLRLQGRLDHHQVAHLPGDGEDEEGVEEHREAGTHPLHPAEQPTAQTGHVGAPSAFCSNGGISQAHSRDFINQITTSERKTRQ